MKDSSKDPQVFKSIATHSLVAAIFSQPWLISLGSDIFTLASGSESASLHEQILSAMSLISTVALLIAVLFYVLYLIRKHK